MFKAFRRAAESLEKLLDVTREELPDTMAAVRLSGMEISDLTMELSDLGYCIYLCFLTLFLFENLKRKEGKRERERVCVCVSFFFSSLYVV